MTRSVSVTTLSQGAGGDEEEKGEGSKRKDAEGHNDNQLNQIVCRSTDIRRYDPIIVTFESSKHQRIFAPGQRSTTAGTVVF
jgi:hypothetical protein